jgi:hypothetical protein
VAGWLEDALLSSLAPPLKPSIVLNNSAETPSTDIAGLGGRRDGLRKILSDSREEQLGGANVSGVCSGEKPAVSDVPTRTSGSRDLQLTVGLPDLHPNSRG